MFPNDLIMGYSYQGVIEKLLTILRDGGIESSYRVDLFILIQDDSAPSKQ